MNQQNINNTYIRPSICYLLEQDTDSNAGNVPTINHQNQSNASSRRYTKEESLVLIRLYGEFYRESNNNQRVLSPRRIQLNNESWKSITDRYNEETGSQRSAKALKEKLELLKSTSIRKTI